MTHRSDMSLVQTTAEPESVAATGTFAALRIKNFAWFLAGTTLSNSAQWIQQVTLSWLVYEVTGSGAMLGTLNLVRSIATLGLAPMAGVAIDRFSRRGLLFASNGWLFTISVVFGFVLLANATVIWPLYIFALLGGVAQAVSMPLSQTLVFSLVPRSLTPGAVALVQTGWAVMRSIGPALGGFLILWFGPAGNFFVQALAYALVALTITKLNMPSARVDTTTLRTGSSLLEGLRYIAAERTTRAFLLMGWVLPLFIIPIFSALPPIYAKDVFKGGPDTLGLLLSAVGIGGIAGGFVAASLGQLERRGLVQLLALLLLSLSLIGFALSSQLWVALIYLGLSGFFELVYLTSNQTLLQLSIPDALRGRVTGIVSLTSGLMPIGALVAGIGADLIGPRLITILLSGSAAAIAVIVFLASPTIRDYRLSQALAAQSAEKQ
jgi:predicted MFS family arabinose efflux permease